MLLDEEFFIRRVADFLSLKGITKNDLARQANISQDCMRDLMKGKNIPTITTLEKICIALGITVSQFFDTDDAFHDLNQEQIWLIDLWTSFDHEQREHAKIY